MIGRIRLDLVLKVEDQEALEEIVAFLRENDELEAMLSEYVLKEGEKLVENTCVLLEEVE